MAKQISPDQALALSFTPLRYSTPVTDSVGRTLRDKDRNTVYELKDAPRFIKPGEPQAHALKRLRSHHLGRTKQGKLTPKIPAFTMGRTTTAEYVRAFESMNNLVPTKSAAHLTGPAPFHDGPEVVEVLEPEDTCEDLV